MLSIVSLAIEAAFSFGSSDVIRTIENIALERGYPKVVRTDNGSKFCSHKMLRWAADRNIQLHFIQLGKPTQNANIESLNGRNRDELLNPNLFRNIEQVRRAADLGRSDYDDVRPHSRLGYRTPREFAEAFKTKQPSQLCAA